MAVLLVPLVLFKSASSPRNVLSLIAAFLANGSRLRRKPKAAER